MVELDLINTNGCSPKALPTNSCPYSPTFVTELARPATVTDALPGLVAGTVLAARHPHTALTVQPLPAWVTPGGEKHRIRVLGGGCEETEAMPELLENGRTYDSP